MSSFIGNLSVFDQNTQEWEIFHGRLQQFVKLNGGLGNDEGKKRALLLTHLSDDTYRLARNLVHPKTLEAVTYDELVQVLNEHFMPKRCTFADREKFYGASRAEGESIEEWAARVRGLAVHCDFGSALDMLLRDKFILGMSAGPERDRLFELDATKVKFAQAVEVAQQAACARQARAVAAPPHVKLEPVYRVSGKRVTFAAGAAGAASAADETGRRRTNEVRCCAVCGMKNHDADKCRFKGYRRRRCGVKGHLVKVCVKKSAAQLHNIDVDEGLSSVECDEGKDCRECELFNLRCVNCSPILVTVLVNKIKLEMELDSGSSTTVISDKLYRKHFSNVKLNAGDIKMCLYNGHRITPLGYLEAKVTYLNRTKILKIYVIQNGGPPLLGRDFMTKFELYFMTANNKIVSLDQSSNEVPQLLNEFSELFNDELGRFNKFKVELKLKEGSEPKFFKCRTVPFALKTKVEEEIDRLVKLGILVPVNYSKYATPIVPVLKENGKVRIAGDFSVTLNKVILIDKYPLPRIEEVFAKLGGGQLYTKLDLSNAYNQFELSDSSQELTTINTCKGLYKYTRLVYGLANAPAIFQRSMETLLVGIEGVSCWLDDVCITDPSMNVHMSRLREVLSRLRDAGLRLQKEKCAFFQNSVTYLGYVIDRNGLKTCQKKVEAILNAPPPTNVLEVKRFLGVVNYYRNFVPNASSILCPLHDLLRGGAEWKWGERQQYAFESVKRELSSNRVLCHFQPSAKLTLCVDASQFGLGAVLMQQDENGVERPLACASRSLSTSEKNYSQIQKEATAIMFGVKRFHQYLYGRQEPFILKTDHRPLLSIFGNKIGISVMAASRLQRYAIILSAYNYIIEYINSENNLVADYFSRAPLPSTCTEEFEESEKEPVLKFLDANVAPVSFDDIRTATANDKTLQTVIKYMNRGWPRKIVCKTIIPYFQNKTDLEIEDGCLFRGHRVIIPTVFREQMLNELHLGHLGIVKTKSNARSRMWWPGIDGDIERWIGSCLSCASVRSAPPRATPASWPQPAGPWQRLHIDYMTFGQRVYLIVIDAYSKWLECVHMNCGTSTYALIVKLKCLFSKFGIPIVIVSDNDVKINSLEFNNFCSKNGICYITSPIYHPSSNGQAENSVKTCKKMLKCLKFENLSANVIDEKLWGCLFDYRNTKQCSTGKTPAKLMFGRELRTRLDLIFPNKLKTKMTQNNDNHLNNCRQFKVGDYVWLRWYKARKEVWTLGTIIKKIGRRMFEILVKDFNVMCRRHVDQIIMYTGGAITLNQGTDSSVCNVAAPMSSQPRAPSTSPTRSPENERLDNNSQSQESENDLVTDNDEGCDDEWAEATDEPAATLIQGENDALSGCVENGRQSTSDSNYNQVPHNDVLTPVRRHLRPRLKRIDYKKHY